MTREIDLDDFDRPVTTVTTKLELEPFTRTFHDTDAGNAEYFEREAKGHLAFDHTARQWFKFTGHHWEPDKTKDVVERALKVVRQRQRDALLIPDSTERRAALKFSVKSEDRKHLTDLVDLASSKPTIRVDGSNWDCDPMLFGVQNGVLDLDTQRFRAGRPSDYITKVAPVFYDASAACPRFKEFIKEIFADHPELGDYLQRCVGYWLTGLTTEQVFWILWGLGANGKSTLIEVLLHALFGQRAYGWVMPFPTASWTTAISEYQRAELPGRRFVTASEVKQRGHLHEDFIKSLTGGDSVNARQIYGRPFTFVPVGKFVLRCNERPIIRDLTPSMWRRVKLVPFTQEFAVNAKLSQELMNEASGILNWALEGVRKWRTDGLKEPDIVHATTQEYRDDSDVLTHFVDERCLEIPGKSVKGRDLYTAYLRWEDDRRTTTEDRLSQKAFGLRIKAKYPDIGTRTAQYSGLVLRSGEPEVENAP
jgi:putative DNA primase/helicase